VRVRAVRSARMGVRMILSLVDDTFVGEEPTVLQ
jgi:hypothetical protein